MTSLRRPCSWLALGLVTAAVVAAQPTPAPPQKLELEPAAIEAFVAEQLAAKHLVGLSLAVVRDGTVVLAKGFGKRSIADGSAVTPDTRFAVGSITKQFTSACILLLAEDGKLAVTDKVARWYPALTRANDITLLDLMNHVSGYPDYYPLDFVDRPMQKAVAVDELIGRFGTRPLDFEPGTRYSYSNTGFVILGRIVEKVSGEPFGQFLARRILKPLGMTRTLYEPTGREPDLAQGYVTFALSPPEAAVPEGTGWVAAAGAIWSTPSDLAKWDLALVDGTVLKPGSYRLMATPRTLANGASAGYGCGLAIGTRNGQTVLAHSGGVAGFYALNSTVPATRSAVVLLSNLDSYDAVNAIYGPLMAALVATPPKTATPAIAGPPAAEAMKAMFLSLQAGKVDRAQLGEEFSAYLTDAKVRSASERLKGYGEPAKVDVESVAERGGMEVSHVKFTFASGVLKGLMYRTPDGKVQQFFVLPE